MFQDLFAHDIAANAVWWVAGGIFGLLALFALLETADWLGGGIRRLLALAPPPPEPGDEPWPLREPDTELHRRHAPPSDAERAPWARQV